ncbi:MAG: carbamoyl-phosphate synthase large subunit [Alphaproteobacteria bacterium]|jgi:carbamoyl-phosphate synthase large subunit|nr:carbamoyl-phosphate synthase large subunit [Alphaproteobacteria bacterium]
MPTVLVTGVGGGVGQSIVKSLQGSPYTVIGADAEAFATGLYAVAKGYRVPYASAPGYVERLLEICAIENCALILPGLDVELPILSREAEKFRRFGVTAVVSSPEAIEIADDKLATYRFLLENGFHAPLTVPLGENLEQLFFPLVIKPRRGGARSRGVFVVANERELSRRLSDIDPDNYVAQEYITGDEYTCGSVNFAGRCYGTIVMRRILRDGDTYKAFVEETPLIKRYVESVAEALKPFGACNFQFRLRNGEPYIFEINARHSGTTHSRTLAGFNEPRMVADYLLQGRLPEYKISEIVILRYWKELMVEEHRIASLLQAGVVSNDKVRL